MKSKKLHPVVQHLLARKNKKVPVKDGRKIVLVLFGGAMASIQGAGVMIAFNELGLDFVFDEIYASSGGFCNASYLLSGNTREGTSVYYEELSGRNFIDLWKIWNIENVDWVIKCTKEIKPLDVKNILKHPTKLFVQVRNLTKKKIEFLEVHKYKPASYFSILKAAIKMPFLSPGGVHIGKAKLKDTPEKEIFREALNSNATDIVVQYNMSEQYEYIHKHFNKKIFQNNRIFEIKPSSKYCLSRIETNPEILKKGCIKMGTMMKKIFGSRKPISLKYTPAIIH